MTHDPAAGGLVAHAEGGSTLDGETLMRRSDSGPEGRLKHGHSGLRCSGLDGGAGSHEGGCGHDGQPTAVPGESISGPVVSKMDAAGGGRQAATDPSGPGGDARSDAPSMNQGVRRDWAEEEGGVQGMTGGVSGARAARTEDGPGGGRCVR